MNTKIIELRDACDASIEMFQKINPSDLDESRSLSLRFLRMFIRNNQSIALLVDAGFYNEAIAIHRLSLEHLFNIFALIRKSEFITQLKGDPESKMPKALIELSKDIEKAGDRLVTDENVKLLKSAVDEIRESQAVDLGYSIYNAAKSSEMGDFYNSVYRVISLSYAHSTFLSAIKQCDESHINALFENAIDFMRIVTALFRSEFEVAN